MQVEFVGLPGSGKTTLVIALEERLKAEGYTVSGLRNAARRAMKNAQETIGFLQRRGERISLYGCLLWAHKNPELFQWIFKLSHADLVALLWGMEALSQQGILLEHGDETSLIFNDEGYLQRFAWNFIDLDAEDQIKEISLLLPPEFVTVELSLPPALSYDRTKRRRKGVPIGLKCEDDAATLAKFQRYQRVLEQFVAARRMRGCQVLTVDGNVPVDQIAEEVIRYLRPMLPAAAPAAKKKRGKPAS